MSCTTGFGRCDYLDFLPKRPQGATKILGTLALAATKTPAALKFPSKGATTDCVETPVNCPHCEQKWRLQRRLRRQSFILLSFSSSEKLRKAQETQSYQRIQCIGHTDFKGLSNAVTNTHPLLPSMGTTRQKSSCRNRLQNGPRSLSQVKADTHSPSPTGSHTTAHTPKQGLFRMGALLLPSERFARFGNPAWPGVRTAYFAAFGPWSGVLPKSAESLRDSDALMRVAVPRRRGPAGLRDPIAVSLTALMGFAVLLSRFVGTQKIERLFFSYSGAFFEPLFASIHARNLSLGTTIRLPILSAGNSLPCTSS